MAGTFLRTRCAASVSQRPKQCFVQLLCLNRTVKEKYREVDPFRITKGKGFRINDFDPGDTCRLG
jgi:hypothetical protein